jgi:hypothetical protein
MPQIPQMNLGAPMGIPLGMPPALGGIPQGNIFTPEQQQFIY